MKKTLLTIASILSIGAFSFGQSVFSEDFNSGSATGFTVIDNDGDGNKWGLENVASFTDQNIAAQQIIATSYSWDDNVVLTPDNFMVTPAIDLSAHANKMISLSFKIAGLDPDFYAETIGVYVVTGDLNAALAAGVTPVFVKTLDANEAGKFATHVVDISSVAGNGEVRVLFRHFNSTDIFVLALDDINVNVGLSAEALGVTEATIYPNPANDVVNFAMNSNAQSVKVISIDGRIVANLDNVNAAAGQISLADATPGMYIIEIVTTDGLKATNMFVKK